MPHILMCPPDHFGIEYEINPWMDRRAGCNHAAAVQQWQGLRQRLEESGAQIAYLKPMAGLPDLVFTANAALIYGEAAVPARFRHPQRQGEEPHAQRWLAEHGFTLRPLPEGVYFEGAGDALFCADVLFAGYRIRSDIRAYQHLAALLRCRVIPLELVDPRFYHLDTCFCPIAAGRAIYYPAAFDHYGRKVLQSMIGELIDVEDDEAQRFACNAVVVGNRVITNTGCPQLARRLKDLGLDHAETPLDEFLKSGGSAKCLTLRLDGEDAAAWRAAGTARQSSA